MLKRGHKNHPFGLWWLWMKHLKWLQVTAQILSGLLVEEGGGKKGPICHRLTDFFWLKKLAAISVAYILLQYDNCTSSIIGKYTCSWLVSCHAHLSLIIKRLLAKKKMILKLHFLSLTNTVRHEDLQYLSNWHTSGQEWMDLSYQLSNNGP